MSLKDHNISTLMDEVKQQTILIVDENYIEYALKLQGLSLKDAEDKKAKELQRLLQRYAAQHAEILQRTDERRERRETGELHVEADEALQPAPEVHNDYEPFTAEERKTINEYTEAFRYYSKVLQYTLNRATKREPNRFVMQCNHNNSSGFETWRR
eukprot:6486613-Amphidinium_carterae.2